MKSKPLIPSMLFTLSILCAFAIPHTFAIEPAIETAILKGNWEAIVNTLEKDDSKANDPVARLLMAHASLATNRNNAAMMLFLSVKEEGDVTSWSDWTSSLLNKNPENPVALYLHADAQARLGNHSEAVQLLTTATNLPSSPLSQNSSAGEIDSSEMVNYALICNASGVLRMLTNDMDYALIDFLQATRLAPNLADAHANLGSYYIMTEAADGALEEFSNAIEINPEFALAYNGLGCAYFGNGRFEEASQSFSMTSQLCPTLAIAEINQGFASAYSSKLITVAEKITENPGTTFTSISKQYPEILKEQNQQLLKTLPSQKDHEFWKKMDALPYSSKEQIGLLVNEYGLQKVQMGATLQIHKWYGRITEINMENQQLAKEVPSHNKWILTSFGIQKFIVEPAYEVTTTLLSGGTFKWANFITSSALKLDKGITSYAAKSPNEKAMVAVLPTDPKYFTDVNIVGVNRQLKHLGNVSMSIAGDAIRDHHEIQIVKALNKQAVNNHEALILANQIKLTSDNLRVCSGISNDTIKNSSAKIISQIPGYFTATDRPITELGALASMVDKGIKSSGSARSALIVSQDTFRTNLLQSELSKYGFQTKVIPPGTDPQTAARQWGADVILGVKGTPEMKFPQKTGMPLGNSLQKYPGNDNYRKVQPLLPPDNGGGGGGIVNQNWNWGKQYTPTDSKKRLVNGVSTEEIAKAFVDKGNWPVLTTFSLFYK